VLWFIAGHLIESTVILLELIHIHRNYVAYLGPILAAVVMLGRVLPPRRARLGAVLATAVIAGFGVATAQRAHQWSDPYALATYEVLHRPNSARANYELGRLYSIADKRRPNAEHRMLALRHFERAMALDPYSIGAPVALLILRGGADYSAQDPALTALLERLEERPLISKEIHFFRSLVECQEDEACRRPPPEMLEVFARAVGHRAITAEMKADVLAIMGLYYANTLNDLPACIRTMEESVKAMPQDPNYQLNLAQAYLMARRIADAKRTIDSAERLDPFGAYARRIAALRRDLPLLEPERG
jgi:tetratricopeptide (TPR) repeat protein